MRYNNIVIGDSVSVRAMGRPAIQRADLVIITLGPLARIHKDKYGFSDRLISTEKIPDYLNDAAAVRQVSLDELKNFVNFEL